MAIDKTIEMAINRLVDAWRWSALTERDLVERTAARAALVAAIEAEVEAARSNAVKDYILTFNASASHDR